MGLESLFSQLAHFSYDMIHTIIRRCSTYLNQGCSHFLYNFLSLQKCLLHFKNKNESFPNHMVQVQAYIVCNYFIVFFSPYNQYLRHYILSHIISTFSASCPPTSRCGEFKIKLGGIIEVVVLGFDLIIPNYVILVLGNEGGGPHHMQGRYTHGLGIGLRKLVVLTLSIHQVFN